MLEKVQRIQVQYMERHLGRDDNREASKESYRKLNSKISKLIIVQRDMFTSLHHQFTVRVLCI